MNFKEIVYNHKEEIVETFRKLIQIPSVLDENDSGPMHPFGKNIQDALEFMLELGKKDGFEVLNDEGYAGLIKYGSSKDSIGILCHLDVVPEGDNWTYPPYEARVVNNIIYGRGTGDDKGPTIACYYALKFIKEANIKLDKEVQLILGTDEETGWRGISHYLSKYPMPSIGFAPDCDFPVVYGEKGRMSFDLSCDFDDDVIDYIKGGERYNVVLDKAVAKLKIDLSNEFYDYLKEHNLKGEIINNEYVIYGVAAHAMEPHVGINAGIYMCHFLKNYSKNKLVHFIDRYFFEDPFMKKLGLDYTDYEMGPITVNIGIMNIGKNSRVTLDSRFPVRYDIDRFNKVFENILLENNIKVTAKTFKEPHYVDPNDDLVQLLHKAYVKNTNDFEHKPFTVGGGTYAGVLDKGVAFGMLFPGDPELAHQRDECISIDSLLKGILIYIDAILLLGGYDA